MKSFTSSRYLLASCILSASFISPVFANHKSGDSALPEIIVAGDFNQDGKLDLALNVSGFDNIAIFNGDGQGGFTLTKHIQTARCRKVSPPRTSTEMAISTSSRSTNGAMTSG